MKTGILLVEDEEKLRSSIADYLNMKGYIVFRAETGEEGLRCYYENNTRIHLVLLDIMLPGMDGHEVLTELRLESDVPVIMLTACSDEKRQIRSFEYGADIYITKPFRMSILCAQIEAVLRRTKKNISSKSYGDITMDSEQHKAFFNGEEILLTPREFALLLYMAEHINVVLKREQILNAVWGYQYEGGERTVDTVVKHVRAKIADTKCEIQSLYGVGYRFEVRDEINT